MDARVRIHGYSFSCLNISSRSRLFSVLWKAIMPDKRIPDEFPEPSRCWVDTNSVSSAPNRFMRLQSTMLSRLLWRFFKFYIDQFVSTYDYIRPLTRLRDLISTPSEMCCNDTIQFSIDMHCMCKYGCTNEFLPVCIFMFIHLIVILCMLNNIESHNINNNLWNRYDVGSAPVHISAMLSWVAWTSFAPCINQCIYTNDQIMVTHINAIKSGMSRCCPN